MDTKLAQKLNLEDYHLTLKEAYELLEKDEALAIPFLIRLLENPDSPISFPGQIYLREHDYVHILLGRGQSAEDEAYVVGFTMGSDTQTNRIHLAIFKFFARYFYPQKYRMRAKELQVFEKGFSTARQMKITALNRFDFKAHEDQNIASLRHMLGYRNVEDCNTTLHIQMDAPMIKQKGWLVMQDLADPMYITEFLIRASLKITQVMRDMGGCHRFRLRWFR